MADSITRSIAKTITWRIIAVCITMIVAYGVLSFIHPEEPTHKIMETSMIVGVADMLIKMVMYFIHERLWTKVKI